MAAAASVGISRIFEFLAQRTKHIIFVWQPDSHSFQYLNPAFEQVWQKKAQSIMDHPATLLETIHPEDRIYLLENYQKLLKNEEQHNLEFRIILPDGAIRWLCLNAYVNRQEGSPLFTGFAEDVTAGKDHENIVRKFTAKKNALLEILSHDLSGPLVSIQGLASLLTLQVKHKNAVNFQETIDMLEEVASRNVALIRAFVEQEALETAKAALKWERTDIVEKTHYAVEQLKNSQQAISKTFRLLTSAPAIFLVVDEVKFLQVLGILLSNAIKFTYDQGVITTRIEEKDNEVLISVEDDGIGIPAEWQPILFDRFTKAKRPGIRGEKPVGLGMAIAKSIVELHKGRIWVESEEKMGTSVFVALPKA